MKNFSELLGKVGAPVYFEIDIYALLSDSERFNFEVFLELYAKRRDNIEQGQAKRDPYFVDLVESLLKLREHCDFYESVFPPVMVYRKMKTPGFYEISDGNHLIEIAMEGYTELGHTVLYCSKHKFFVEFGHDKCLLFYTWADQPLNNRVKEVIKKELTWSEEFRLKE